MATANNTRIPGLDDLLGSVYRFRDPARAQLAASNVHLPVVNGIGAIGDLLWWASQHEDFGTVGRETIGDIGLLVKELAGLAHTMQTVEHNAGHQLSEQRATTDSGFADIPVIGKAS